MVERKQLMHVPEKYQTYIKSGDTDSASDRRQLLRIDDYLDFAGMEFEAHDNDTLEEYIQHCLVNRDNDRHYVRQQFFFIRKFYDWLVPKTIAENPADFVDTQHYFGKGKSAPKKEAKTPDDEETIYYFEKDQVTSMIEHAPQPVARNRAMIKTMYVTGPRAKEVTLLKWSDIQWKNRVITYVTAKQRGKTDTRDVPFPKTLERYLRRWQQKQKANLGGANAQYVFTGRERDESGQLRAISPKQVNLVVRKAVDSADFKQETAYVDSNGRERRKFTSHSLRHGYAVHFVESGGDIKSLRDLLGHSSTAITERYLHFKESTLLDIGRRHGPK